MIILELKFAKALAEESAKIACNLLEIEYIDTHFINGNKFENDNVSSTFDRYLYVVKFNIDWLLKASEKDIILTAYYQVRQGYQQTQIEFRQQLISAGVFVEPIEKVRIWEDEFSYYTEPTGDEKNDSDYMSLDTVVDGVSFACVLYKNQHEKDTEIPDVIVDRVNERIKEIINNHF